MLERRVSKCRISSVPHNGNLVSAFNFLTNPNQEFLAMAKIKVVHGIWRLICVQLNADIIAPFPSPVALVGNDSCRYDSAGNAFIVVCGEVND